MPKADPQITAQAIRGLMTGAIERYQHLADNASKRADRADARFAVKVITELRVSIFGT